MVLWCLIFTKHLSHLMTKPTKWFERPAKTQISLDIRPIWSESSLCAKWVATCKDPVFLHADSEDSDQTGRMPRLIWVFTVRTFYFVGFVIRRLICLWYSTFVSSLRPIVCVQWTQMTIFYMILGITLLKSSLQSSFCFLQV